MDTRKGPHGFGAGEPTTGTTSHASHTQGSTSTNAISSNPQSQQLSTASQGHCRDASQSISQPVKEEISETSLVSVPVDEQLPTQTNPPTNAPAPEMQSNISQDILSLSDDELGGDAHETYNKSPQEPPITPDSLSELETTRIFNNPKLRHDVNFDRELHFRPNTDGSRGKQKLKSAKRFWKAIQYELRCIEKIHKARLMTADPEQDERYKKEIQVYSKRLRTVFAAVRDILKSLVPEAEQSKISDRLDVDFLMQQITNGVLDLVDLATWLAKVIKTHCAPMRDAKVNFMQKTVIKADATKDLHLLTDGLRQLVDLMEAMKLDVANHQIRHIRVLLIKNTVDFQQRYNKHRVEAGKMDTAKSIAWLKSEIELTDDEILPSTPLDAICSALLWDMISPQGTDAEPFTPTFYLDYDRLRSLSAELHTDICREVCQSILSKLHTDPACKWEAHGELQAFLAAEVVPQDWFQNNIENIAAQIARIIATTPGPQGSDEATIFQNAVECLTQDLSKSSPDFATHKATMFHRVLPKLQKSVHKHIKLTALELQDALVPHVAKTSTRSTGYGAVLHLARPDDLVDADSVLVRRLTHIIVLHWQVWSDMLYLRAPEIVRITGDDTILAESDDSSYVNGSATSNMATTASDDCSRAPVGNEEYTGTAAPDTSHT